MVNRGLLFRFLLRRLFCMCSDWQLEETTVSSIQKRKSRDFETDKPAETQIISVPYSLFVNPKEEL